MARGYKNFTIVDRLAGELLLLFGDHLNVQAFKPDRLVLHVLLTISKVCYVNQLLFRDFVADRETQWCIYDSVDDQGNAITEKIHTQAFTYVEELLVRRLTLAQNLNDRPSNMHLLLAVMCRYGPDQHWQQTSISRDSSQCSVGEDCDFFRPVALELADKRARLGEHFSDISRNRRTEYGPIWLKVDPCAAEVPEELSLIDVLEIVPKPLTSTFSENIEVQRVFSRVVDALNERYMLLRSCGLDPDQWLTRSEPSINNLKDLKQLRKHAQELLVTNQAQDSRNAYCCAFNELRSGRKKFAGYPDFDEFALSEIGRTLLRYVDYSLDESNRDEYGEEELSLPEIIPGTAGIEETVEFERKVEALLQDKPELVGDSVTRYCFLEVIGRGRGWYGISGVLNDPAFQRLIKTYPLYSGLCEEELIKRLLQQLDQLIEQGLTDNEEYP